MGTFLVENFDRLLAKKALDEAQSLLACLPSLENTLLFG